MTLSYCITVKDEFVEIQRLVSLILNYRRIEDPIIVAFDDTGDVRIEEYLRAVSVGHKNINWYEIKFNKDFSELKNSFSKYVTTDYIFQLDADEYPSDDLIKDLPEWLELNSTSELFMIPRLNTVKGLTQDHINKWHWHVSSDGRINWPDLQSRVYKNSPNIRWINKVHERIDGHKTYNILPMNDNTSYFIHHPKDITKQEKQNQFYDTLMK